MSLAHPQPFLYTARGRAMGHCQNKTLIAKRCFQRLSFNEEKKKKKDQLVAELQSLDPASTQPQAALGACMQRVENTVL